jgi:hypothetical protein
VLHLIPFELLQLFRELQLLLIIAQVKVILGHFLLGGLEMEMVETFDHRSQLEEALLAAKIGRQSRLCRAFGQWTLELQLSEPFHD